MASGMATMDVTGSPTEPGPDAASTPAHGIPTPHPRATDPGPGRVDAPTIPLPAPTVTAASSACPAERSDRPRPSPRPRPVPAPADACPAAAAPADACPAAVAPAAAAAELGEQALAATRAPVDLDEAEEFLRLYYGEADDPGATSVKGATGPAAPLEERLAEVRDEVAATGTYVHTAAELTFGARVAWRNSARCIGRLYWRSLHLRDRRHVVAPDEVAAECVGHLDEATRRGRIRSTITVFAPDAPGRPGPRIRNEQLVRYAGYRTGGRVLGDPRHVGVTDDARALGWVPPSPMSRFDVLPLVVSGGGEWAEKGPQFFEVPRSSVLEVELTHPDHPWFAELGLRWHALPVISNMRLDVGGISYPAAPFNGWYMATEIGARNLADTDRYDMLVEVAQRMGLDTSSERTMWRDRAGVELTLAVQHSFDEAGVSMADHHGESQRFLRHLEREEGAGRSCPVDWSWIVPPISGGLTPVFHRYYDPPTDSGPMFR